MIYSAFPHLNGNLLAAIDFETTGALPGYHEPVQIAVLPLDSDCRPLKGVTPFYSLMRPEHPERMDPIAMGIHHLSPEELAEAPHPDRVADYLIEWFDRLDMPIERNLVPLAANWPFECGFLLAWLGEPLMRRLFNPLYRDVMVLALAINDRSFFMAEKTPFNRVGLASLCEHFGVVNQKPHDALSDCLAEAEVYRHLVKMGL